MIKSVAAPMPTHVMSCFRLPKGVTKKIQAPSLISGGVEVEIKKEFIGFLGIKCVLLRRRGV